MSFVLFIIVFLLAVSYYFKGSDSCFYYCKFQFTSEVDGIYPNVIRLINYLHIRMHGHSTLLYYCTAFRHIILCFTSHVAFLSVLHHSLQSMFHLSV